MGSGFATRLGGVLPSSELRVAMFQLAGVRFGCRPKVERFAFLSGCSLGDDCEVRTHARVVSASVGGGSVIDVGAMVLGTQRNPIRIGKQSYIGYYTILDGSGGLSIGDSVHMSGPGVAVWTHSTIGVALRGDALNDPTHRMESPVTIGDRVWIGAQVTVYPGVRIEPQSVVLPHSVVNRDVKSGTMVGGVPAKIVRDNLAPEDFPPQATR